MKNKVSSNRTSEEIERLLFQIEKIKGNEARLEEVNKQLKDVERNMLRINTDHSNETNGKVGNDANDYATKSKGAKGAYKYQKLNILEHSEAVEREMEKLKETLRRGGRDGHPQ